MSEAHTVNKKHSFKKKLINIDKNAEKCFWAKTHSPSHSWFLSCPTQHESSSSWVDAAKKTVLPLFPIPRWGLWYLSMKGRFLISPSSMFQRLYSREKLVRSLGLSSFTQLLLVGWKFYLRGHIPKILEPQLSTPRLICRE